MSVEIYGVEENSSKFRCIAVSGEAFFNRIWESIIEELNLQLIGNGVWLYREKLQEILIEFGKVKTYMQNTNKFDEADKKYVIQHIDYILGNLEANWNEVKTAERLWMG